MRRFLNQFVLIALLLVGILTEFSCNTTKKVKYFQDIPDSGRLNKITGVIFTEPVIKKDDILNILVQTLDPQATISINTGNLPITSGLPGVTQNNIPTGYLVNSKGYIELPVVGSVFVLGYTTSQLQDTIQSKVSKYFKNPTVNVRFANFKVSVTGEVARPGQYIMPNEKVTIIDALAMAGDLTIFGKRENILLIREENNGEKMPYRINLKSSDMMSQPYYYLRQNDIIYVEPRKSKSDITDASQTRFVTIAGSLLSVLIILATRL